VAWRVALKARSASKHRAGRLPRPEEEPPDPRPDPLGVVSARELLLVLEEEVQRLPPTQRMPVVLCCLEGLSQEEAARRLGWGAGRIRGRLERGRRRLEARLARRGFTLSAGLAVAGAARGTTAVSVGLVGSTTRAATLFAAGRVTAGASSPLAIALAEGVWRAMLMSKLKVTAGLVLLACCVAAFGAALAAAGGQPSPAEGTAVPGESAKARPGKAGAEAPASYVRVEVKGKLVRQGNLYVVEAADASFADTKVVVALQRGEDKDRALDAHLKALEGKVVVATGFLDCRKLGSAKVPLTLYLRSEKQVQAAGKK